jgi:DNA-binding SARP family transcriptional activator
LRSRRGWRSTRSPSRRPRELRSTSGRRRRERLGRRQQLRLYAGDLLPDDPYEPWTAAPQERLRQRHLELLDLLAAEALTRDADDALGLLERGIEADPLDDDRYVRAARLLLAQGKRLRAASMLRRGEQVFERLGLPLPEAYRRLAREVLPPAGEQRP